MASTTSIGLDKKLSKQLAEQLNVLLANYQVFYMNVRGFHWNIKGQDFFVLHPKFEELYNDALVRIDEIAERILTLGFTPLHAYSDYFKASSIKELKNVTEGQQSIRHIIDGLGTLIGLEREILKLSEKAGDDGTNDMMTVYVREQEKMVWMYTSDLK